MKKSIVKSLSAFLALVLILSVLPMAAFAAEACAHTHTSVYADVRYTNLGVEHYVAKYNCYVCADCGYSWETLLTSSLGDHEYKYTNDGINYYCVCGAKK